MAHATQRSHQAPGDPETRQVQHPAMKGWPSPKEGGQAMLHNGHLTDVQVLVIRQVLFISLLHLALLWG